MKRIIIGVAICLSVIVCFIFFAPNRMFNLFSSMSANSPTNSFGYVKGKLAIVAFPKGQGTGFLIKQAEKKYLVTNEHVIRGGNGEEPRIMMLNGNVLKLGNCEISRDRDLMRFEVDTDSDALFLADTIPEIGEEVTIYGNSDGGGVSTQISGKVLGVGGERLEVSALFVNGNSGSPVINQKGLVVGVATYLTNYTNANDWVKKDTRFNGVRRYATRLVDMPWYPISWDEYARQIREFNDFEYFLKCLRPYLLAYYDDIANEDLSYSEVNRMEYNSLSNGLHNAMIAVRNSYRNLAQDSVEWQRVSKGKDNLIDYLKGKKTDEKIAIMKEYDAIALDKFATVVERLFEFNQCLRDALDSGQKMLQKSKITLPLLKYGLGESSGVDRYRTVIGLFQVDLEERLSSCSNVMEYATKLTDDMHMNGKELGWVLLNHIARDGSRPAQKKIIELYEKQFDLDLLNGSIRDEHVQAWIKEGFKEGKKKLGLFLGELAYQRMQYKDAEMYWTAAATEGVVDGWIRLGEFHLLKQEHGGGPESMRKIEIARKAFKTAYELGATTAIQLKVARYYGKVLLNSPLQKGDIVKASEIFSTLIQSDPKNAYNYAAKGAVTYVLEHGRCNGLWKAYINQAADLGNTWAKNCLSEQSILYKYYKNTMEKMHLLIGGIGVSLKQSSSKDRHVRISSICPNSPIGDYYSTVIHKDKPKYLGNGFWTVPEPAWEEKTYDWIASPNILAIGQRVGGEMIETENLSIGEVASLLRGDVGTIVVVKLGNGKIYNLKRIAIKNPTLKDG